MPIGHHAEGELRFTPDPEKLEKLKKVRKSISEAGGDPDILPKPEKFGLSKEVMDNLFVNDLAEHFCYDRRPEETHVLEINEYIIEDRIQWLEHNVQIVVDFAKKDGAVVNGRVFQVDGNWIEVVDVVDNVVTRNDGFLGLYAILDTQEGIVVR